MDFFVFSIFAICFAISLGRSDISRISQAFCKCSYLVVNLIIIAETDKYTVFKLYPDIVTIKSE